MMRSVAVTSQLQQKTIQTSTTKSSQQSSITPSILSRRNALLALPLIGGAIIASTFPSPSIAAPIVTNKEVDNATSPFIQDLLRKTAEKKDDRKKERLDDYYRRNFGDYFEFQAGNMNGLSPETQAGITAWLEKNNSKSMPRSEGQE